LMRGSCDFESVEAYRGFLEQVMEAANKGRSKRLTEELACSKRLTRPISTEVPVRG